MKAHKVVLVFVDHDGIGAEEAKLVLENNRYPNRCMSPEVLDVQTVDVGEWSDDHPLNQTSTATEEWRKIFPDGPSPGARDASRLEEGASQPGPDFFRCRLCSTQYEPKESGPCATNWCYKCEMRTGPGSEAWRSAEARSALPSAAGPSPSSSPSLPAMDLEAVDNLQIIKAKMEIDKACDCPDCRDKRWMVAEIERLRALPLPRPMDLKPIWRDLLAANKILGNLTIRYQNAKRVPADLIADIHEARGLVAECAMAMGEKDLEPSRGREGREDAPSEPEQPRRYYYLKNYDEIRAGDECWAHGQGPWVTVPLSSVGRLRDDRVDVEMRRPLPPAPKAGSSPPGERLREPVQSPVTSLLPEGVEDPKGEGQP